MGNADSDPVNYWGFQTDVKVCQDAGVWGQGSGGTFVIGSENEDFLTVIRRYIEGTFNDVLLKIFQIFVKRTPSLQKAPCDPRLGNLPGGCSTDYLRITVRPLPTMRPVPTL